MNVDETDNQASRRLSYTMQAAAVARWTFKVLGFCAMAGSLIFHGRKTDRRPFPGRGINFLPTTTQSQRVKGHLSHLGRSTIEFRHGGERRPHHQLEIKCPWIQEGRCAQNKVLTSSIWIDDRVTQHMVGGSQSPPTTLLIMQAVSDQDNQNDQHFPSFLPRTGNP